MDRFKERLVKEIEKEILWKLKEARAWLRVWKRKPSFDVPEEIMKRWTIDG